MNASVKRFVRRLAVALLVLVACCAAGLLWGAYPDQAEVTRLEWRFDAVASEMAKIVRELRLRGGPNGDEIVFSDIRDSALLASERSSHLADLAAIAAETNESDIREFCEKQIRSSAMGQLYSEFAILADISQAQRAAKRYQGKRAGELALELSDALEQYVKLLRKIAPETLVAPPPRKTSLVTPLLPLSSLKEQLALLLARAAAQGGGVGAFAASQAAYFAVQSPQRRRIPP